MMEEQVPREFTYHGMRDYEELLLFDNKQLSTAYIFNLVEVKGYLKNCMQRNKPFMSVLWLTAYHSNENALDYLIERAIKENIFIDFDEAYNGVTLLGCIIWKASSVTIKLIDTEIGIKWTKKSCWPGNKKGSPDYLYNFIYLSGKRSAEEIKEIESCIPFNFIYPELPSKTPVISWDPPLKGLYVSRKKINRDIEEEPEEDQLPSAQTQGLKRARV